MTDAEFIRLRSARLRWRQGAINLVLAILAAWLLPEWDPNFIVLGLFPFGVLRLAQGIELRLGLVAGGWTDIPATPPVLGCWAAAAVTLQRLLAQRDPVDAGWFLFWLALGILLYAGGRLLQMRYYARYQRQQAPSQPGEPKGETE
ncbi:MAG TPA: hypothetical protein GX715_01340 [Armatimonadetes bacterium]|jgi:hypothetical protein|nr:hypothetical protein [Armatimonadota bacterium]